MGQTEGRRFALDWVKIIAIKGLTPMGHGISVAMMTHNETTEFRWLMEALMPALDVIDEIVIMDDFSNPDFMAAVREFEGKMPLRFFQRALNKNFARQRNYLKSLCYGRLIFFPDPDELPPTRVLHGLPRILQMMEELDIDACQLPRLNVSLDGDELVHPRSIDLEDKRLTISWEDQFRILRNLPCLRWTMRANEYLTGVRRGYRFPHTLDYALLHCKTRQRQARQQVFYRSIRMRHLSRMRNSIIKRLPWRQPTEWVSLSLPI
jgi:glycosyltransferase involved in cell wall biosynthesis